tara:strand:+ start:454 stop:696 length:243 start_codon:yes stop_codon:yes gene_type:complete
MTDKYKVPDILEAVDTLLNNNNKEKPLILEGKKEKPLILEEKKERPLKLTDQVKNLKKELQNVPNDTEKIILQAERYLKK